MIFGNQDNEALLTELALIFPDASLAGLGRSLSHAHERAFNDSWENELIRKADKAATAGHLRRAYANSQVHEFAGKHGWKAEDVKMGKGNDNHVEMRFGRLVATCHHVPNGHKIPKKAKYLEQAWDLNELLSQMELFKVDEAEPQRRSTNVFNLMIVYTTNEDDRRQIGDIDFVFATQGETLAEFSITDVIRHQQALYSLPSEELFELKVKFNRFQKGA